MPLRFGKHGPILKLLLRKTIPCLALSTNGFTVLFWGSIQQRRHSTKLLSSLSPQEVLHGPKEVINQSGAISLAIGRKRETSSYFTLLFLPIQQRPFIFRRRSIVLSQKAGKIFRSPGMKKAMR